MDDGLVLTGEWRAEAGWMWLILRNAGAVPITLAEVALSGPLMMADGRVENARLLRRVGTFCALSPVAALTLSPGEDWRFGLATVFPAKHWTDGVASAVVTAADGQRHHVTCCQTALAGAAPAPRRGAMLPDSRHLGPAILPWPNRADFSGRRMAPEGLAISAEGPDQIAARRVFVDLVTGLFPGEGLVRTAHQGGMAVTLVADSGQPEEGYLLDLAPDGARIAAAGHVGWLYGLITLAQMLRGARQEPHRHPMPAAARIEDAPAMPWRGSHLDVARRFYGVDEVARFIRILAWNKMNRLHWHLSEDEAWRIEIRAYPELTRIGAWQGLDRPIPPQLGAGPDSDGGYYTQDEVRDLVALAGGLGIAVIPEIDMPGHCWALLQALPQLADPGENGIYHSGQQFPNNCLNPGVEAVYPAIETILDEMLALFPAPWFHIGGDEVPEGAWEASPLARALPGGTMEKQAHFLRRIQDFLRGRGRITGGWEEAALGGGLSPDQAYLIGWRTLDANRELAAAGYDVVVSPGQRYYLDMALSPDWDEPGASWAGWSDARMTYDYDPLAGWSAAERARFIGVQSAIWSEPMRDRAVFDRLVFPRISAVAETGWTAAAAKDWPRFSANAALMPLLYNQRS